MYFAIMNKSLFQYNKNLRRSYTCKILDFFSISYKLVSKNCIKGRKTLEKPRKSLGGGGGLQLD